MLRATSNLGTRAALEIYAWQVKYFVAGYRSGVLDLVQIGDILVDPTSGRWQLLVSGAKLDTRRGACRRRPAGTRRRLPGSTVADEFWICSFSDIQGLSKVASIGS